MYNTINDKHKHDIQQQLTTSVLQAPDLAHTECGVLNMFLA